MAENIQNPPCRYHPAVKINAAIASNSAKRCRVLVASSTVYRYAHRGHMRYGWSDHGSAKSAAFSGSRHDGHIRGGRIMRRERRSANSAEHSTPDTAVGSGRLRGLVRRTSEMRRQGGWFGCGMDRVGQRRVRDGPIRQINCLYWMRPKLNPPSRGSSARSLIWTRLRNARSRTFGYEDGECNRRSPASHVTTFGRSASSQRSILCGNPQPPHQVCWRTPLIVTVLVATRVIVTKMSVVIETLGRAYCLNHG